MVELEKTKDIEKIQSVKIYRTSKGIYSWEIKIDSEEEFDALQRVKKINEEMLKEFGGVFDKKEDDKSE